MEAFWDIVGRVLVPLLAVIGSLYAVWRGVQKDRVVAANELAENIDTHTIALIQSAQEVQTAALTRAEAEIEKLRKRNDDLHDTVNRVVGQLGETKVQHQQCQDDLRDIGNRLRIAEGRIAELGG